MEMNLNQSSWCKLLLTCLLWMGLALGAPAKGLSLKTEANVMVELTFTATRTYSDPFNEVTLDAVFHDPEGRELRVPAFWAGSNVWKARYASPVLGTHRFRSECSEPKDKGLHDISGKVEVKPYTGKNPLFTHGPLKLSSNRRFMEHTDGTPFFWLGDTWWMGLCHRMSWPEDFQKLAADRKEKGFNVIQIVMGLYPDMHPFDPRGANEAGFPWDTNYTSIRPEYFDAADRRLAYLVEQGFTPCIFGAWGHYVTGMGVERAKQHWRYLIARYGAWPVVWSAAGEANLPWYGVEKFPYDDRKQAKDWSEVMRYIRATDPFQRLLTIHPTGLKRLSSRHVTDDSGLLDFDMLQTPHGRRDAVAETVKNVRQSYADNPVAPVINGEASYEMLEAGGGPIPTEWPRRMFWLCLMNGAAGHTYGANGIWQVNRKGQPHGPSPTAGSPPHGYGAIPWDEAMNFPGSRQVAFGKKLFEQYPWQDFRPHPEWASFTRKASLKFDGCQWIWFPEGEPAKSAPDAKRYFRRAFVLPEGKTVDSAQLRVSVDDQFTARLNGAVIGASARTEKEMWKLGKQFDDLAGRLKPGTNVLAIEAENMTPTTAGAANPAGLLARVEIRFTDKTSQELVSDATWSSATNAVAGWDQADFDDAAWAKAIAIGKYGDGPWGPLEAVTNDDVFGPQATGIPGMVRVIYVPEGDPIVVNNLGRQAEYAASYFDPVSGVKTPLPTVRADDYGRWKCPPPPGFDHDWVLILEGGSKERADARSGNRSCELTLANDQLAWHFDWSDGQLRSLHFDNKLSGHRFALSDVQELALMFSAALDQPAQPMARAADFEVRGMRRLDAEHAVFDLHSPTLNLGVALHFQLEGPTRRKWAEVTNQSGKELLLLDVELDDFKTGGLASGGGEGQPVFVEGEFFAAIEHPAGTNRADNARVQLTHFPGKRLAVGATFRSHVALVSVAKAGQARPHFVSYLQGKSRRPKRAISVFTPFGINNLWGGCPTLDDEETLHVLDVVEQWQKKGMRFDYFTLDTGWVDPTSDLTRFRPTCYPNGPGKIVERVKALNMKFGLWFATSWGAQSAWENPAAFPGGTPPGLPWREGYPITREGINFCVGTKHYHEMLKNAVLYHMRSNNVRLLKFDGGDYVCNVAGHGHLTDKYSVEARFANLIDIADAARATAPDVFIIWYWGLRSPFWALHGDMIFESGLHMEGSGTSSTPTLYYRDSVNLALDQNAQHARNIPPITKDSLGVWLAEDRWGNYMGKQRWREAMVMDLGRGNLFVPNLWGNLYLFDDADLSFLQKITAFARKHEALLLHRRNILGNPFRNEVYGYAYGQDKRGLLFLNNDHFTVRPARLRLDSSLGLSAKPGTTLNIVSHFPEETRLLRPDGARYQAGDALEIWLRPFEFLMLEVKPDAKGVASLPTRNVSRQQAADLGAALTLKTNALDPRMDIRFADAARFEGQKFQKKVRAFETTLPSLEGEQPILAVTIRLRKDRAEWKHKPTVVQIVQALARIGDQNVQLHPVPDSRQYGNTQAEGCSWVTFKVRLNPKWSGQQLKLAVHAYLPDGVEAEIESWVVKRWWQEDNRPSSNGYYTDEPS